MVRTEKSGTIEFDLDVHNGKIQHIKIFGDYFSRFDTDEIESALTGVGHQESSIREALEPYKIDDYFTNLTMNEFIEGMF